MGVESNIVVGNSTAGRRNRGGKWISAGSSYPLPPEIKRSLALEKSAPGSGCLRTPRLAQSSNEIQELLL
jgi:hypothetical protein